MVAPPAMVCGWSLDFCVESRGMPDSDSRDWICRHICSVVHSATCDELARGARSSCSGASVSPDALAYGSRCQQRINCTTHVQFCWIITRLVMRFGRASQRAKLACFGITDLWSRHTAKEEVFVDRDSGIS